MIIPLKSFDKYGFSLVELSIVLVILGLLTGGILTGQSLIKTAELRAITTEYNNFAAAVNIFEEKYFALPGDMPNAELFWNQFGSCGSGGLTTTGNLTCNGNGDGFLTDASGGDRVGETVMFWQHLARAGLIEGQYSGVNGPSDNDTMLIGINVPKSRYPNSGWSIDQYTNILGNSYIYDNNLGNVMLFGAQVTEDETNGKTLTPEEA